MIESLSRMLGIKNELYYCRILAEIFGAEMEHVLFNNRRVDLMFALKAPGTDVFGDNLLAVEVDWAKKWAEGVGQAIYYGAATQRRPGLILLTKRSRADQERDIASARMACMSADVKLWVYATKYLDDYAAGRSV